MATVVGHCFIAKAWGHCQHLKSLFMFLFLLEVFFKELCVCVCVCRPPGLILNQLTYSGRDSQWLQSGAKGDKYADKDWLYTHTINNQQVSLDSFTLCLRQQSVSVCLCNQSKSKLSLMSFVLSQVCLFTSRKRLTGHWRCVTPGTTQVLVTILGYSRCGSGQNCFFSLFFW